MNDRQKLIDAKQLALDLMYQWGISDDGWVFQWSNGKRQLGAAGTKRNRRTGEITIRYIKLSRYLVLLNDWDQITDTILHEIAHALAGHAAGHGPIWKKQCMIVGANPQRCADTSVITPQDHKYEMLCGCCNKVLKKYYRVPSRKVRLSLGQRWGTCCGIKAKGQLSIRQIA